MNVLVSACLLGLSCRYDGQSKGHSLAGELVARHTAIPVCPEIFGGLSTPRPPSDLGAALRRRIYPGGDGCHRRL